MGVGAMLAEHASALDQATTSLMRNAFVNDNYSKEMGRERLAELFKLPPATFEQYILYTDTEPSGSPNAEGDESGDAEGNESGGESGQPKEVKKLIKWNFKVPGLIFDNGTSLEVKKYIIDSTFESQIKKHTEVTSDTDAKISGSTIALFIPKINFDITEKIHTGYTDDTSSQNTFNIHIEMGQSDPAFGYIEIVKAFVRGVNRALEFVFSKGGTPISDEEAAELEKDGVPTEEKDANQEAGQEAA